MRFGTHKLLLCALISSSAAVLEPSAEPECLPDGSSLSLLQSSLEHKAISSLSSGSSLALGLNRRHSFEAVQSGGKTKVIHKQAYFGKVMVGTPSQEFTVVFDTGSGNLLIPGTDCLDTACAQHVQFDQKKSSTVKDVTCSVKTGGSVDDKLSITFGTGNIAGNCLEDNICIGHICARGTFVSATSESDHPFSSFKFDGVMGLAMDNMAHAPEYSLMARMVKSKVLAQPLFSVFLSDSDDETSEISFGNVPKDHMASELFWVPVGRTTGYWEVQIDDISFDNKKQKICTDCHVAVDTGTSELAGPSDIIARLRKDLGVQGDCSNFDKLPKLGFVLGTYVLNLEPKDYVNTDSGKTSCSVGLMDLDVPPPKGPLFVFGIPFLQKFFTVYDHANSKVGFALAKHKGGQPLLLETVEEDAPAAVSQHHF